MTATVNADNERRPESYRLRTRSGKILEVPIVGPENVRCKVRERVAQEQPLDWRERLQLRSNALREQGTLPMAPVQAAPSRAAQESPSQPVQAPAGPESCLLRCKSVNDWCREASKRQNPRELWLKTWYEGEVCCLFSDSNLGKSIYAVQIAEDLARKEMRVLYLDFELSDKQFQLRYTDGDGKLHTFPETFFRADMRAENMTGVDNDFESLMMEEVEKMALSLNASVIVIDNITYINSLTESADAASSLMMKLLRLKKKHEWSILALAHTPKRITGAPLTGNDLAGSKRLFNFFDSVLAIGRSCRDEKLRYIKQIKVRYGEFVYDADNVIVCEIVKNGDMLAFRSRCMEPERKHLQTPDDRALAELPDKVRELHKQGKSLRQIGTSLGISHSRVRRILQADAAAAAPQESPANPA